MINDGSYDKSLELCHQYSRKDKRIRVIDQENQGASVARNRGIEVSQGEWIVFVDADDFISSDFLQMVSQEKEADFLLFDFERGKSTSPPLKKSPNVQRIVIPLTKTENRVDLIERLLLFKQLIPKGHMELRAPWAKAFRKSILDQNHLQFTPKLKVGEDALFNIEFLCKAQCCHYIPKPVYFHTICLDSMTHRFVPGLLESFSIFQRGMKKVLLQEDLYSDLKRAYMANTLENMAYLLIKGIFNPYSSNTFRENRTLCKKMREDPIYKEALKYNYTIGNLPRRILLGFFQIRWFWIVRRLCKICFICLEEIDKRQVT